MKYKITRTNYRALEEALIYGLDTLHLAEFKLNSFKRDFILMYHSVETERSGYQYAISKENFAKHLEFLKKKVKVVSLEEMFNTAERKWSRVAITFDDAHEDFYTNAYPLLQAYQLPATVFVPTKFIEEGGQLLRDMGFPYDKGHMNWQQMREVSSSNLIAFESHTHSHLDAVSCPDLLKADVELSIQLLEKHLGRRPKYFAYPHGRYTFATHEILEECGFHRLLTSDYAYIKGKPVEGRFDIYNRTEDMAYFKLNIAGMMTNNIKHFVRRTQSRSSVF
jgi:peptidoglycan/xylan/chitin deacetylase (PgdA/CDA1 family)